MNRPPFSEETILSVAKTTLSIARNNAAALAGFGITEDYLNEFESKIQAAEALPGETRNRIDLRAHTSDKNQALASCYRWGLDLRMRLEMAFGKTSSQYKSFPGKQFDLAQRSENAMMAVIEVLLALADKYKTELASFGQTPQFFTEGEQYLAELRAKDTVQELQKETKQQATQERYVQFQELYNRVNKINRVGRLVFKNDPIRMALFESKWPRRGTRVTVVEESETATEVEQPDAEETP